MWTSRYDQTNITMTSLTNQNHSILRASYLRLWSTTHTKCDEFYQLTSQTVFFSFPVTLKCIAIGINENKRSTIHAIMRPYQAYYNILYSTMLSLQNAERGLWALKNIFVNTNNIFVIKEISMQCV